MNDGSKGCIAILRPPKNRRLPGKSCNDKKLVPLLCQSALTAFSPVKKETAFIQQGELRASHHLLPRAGVFYKIPRIAGSGKQG